MKDNFIGFRLDFSNAKPEDIKIWLNKYLEEFGRYEIKTTKSFISSGKLEEVIKISEEIAKGRYSIHLPKNMLVSDLDYNLSNKILDIISKIKISHKLYLVTHIPNIDPTEYLNKILMFSRRLPENCLLLLENEVTNNNCQYLDDIEYVFRHLKMANLDNIKFCLDIGHLLFGFHSENISQEDAIKYISMKFDILKEIKEIHIHNYNEKDHLLLTDGLMNFNLISKFLSQNDLIVPIIIEATIYNLYEDGLKQVEVLREIK